MLPVEQVEEGAEEVAEDESAENGGKDETFEDRRDLLHLHSPPCLSRRNTVVDLRGASSSGTVTMEPLRVAK